MVVRDNISRGDARSSVRAGLGFRQERNVVKEEEKKENRRKTIPWDDCAFEAARLPIESFNASRLSIPRHFSLGSLDSIAEHAVITSSRPPEI